MSAAFIRQENHEEPSDDSETGVKILNMKTWANLRPSDTGSSFASLSSSRNCIPFQNGCAKQEKENLMSKRLKEKVSPNQYTYYIFASVVETIYRYFYWKA
jgi:hypothetical protein